MKTAVNVHCQLALRPTSTELILLANWGFDRALSLIFKDCLTLNGTSIWNPASGSSYYFMEKHIFFKSGKKIIEFLL